MNLEIRSGLAQILPQLAGHSLGVGVGISLTIYRFPLFALNHVEYFVSSGIIVVSSTVFLSLGCREGLEYMFNAAEYDPGFGMISF